MITTLTLTGSTSLTSAPQTITLTNLAFTTPSSTSVSESDVTAHEAAIDHDALLNFEVSEHIDWAGASAGTIHSSNYTNTTYTIGDGGLTENNFTNADHSKLDAIEAGATATESIVISVSDEATALEAGTAKVTFRMPYAFTVTGVRANVTTAPTGSLLTVDINEGGTSILSTKLTIDATEKTSTTAATAAVVSDTALADDSEITIDIDSIGSVVAGAGLVVALIGTQA